MTTNTSRTETSVLQKDVAERGPLFCLDWYIERRDEIWDRASRQGRWVGATTTCIGVPLDLFHEILRVQEQWGQAYSNAQRAAFA